MIQGIKEEIGRERGIQQKEQKHNKRGNSNVYTIRVRYVCEQRPKLTGETVKKKEKEHNTVK